MADGRWGLQPLGFRLCDMTLLCVYVYPTKLVWPLASRVQLPFT